MGECLREETGDTSRDLTGLEIQTRWIFYDKEVRSPVFGIQGLHAEVCNEKETTPHSEKESTHDLFERRRKERSGTSRCS